MHFGQRQMHPSVHVLSLIKLPCLSHLEQFQDGLITFFDCRKWIVDSIEERTSRSRKLRLQSMALLTCKGVSGKL